MGPALWCSRVSCHLQHQHPMQIVSSSRGSSASDPAPWYCAWEGSRNGPRAWYLTPMWKTRMEFPVPCFDLVQTWLTWPLGGVKQ